MNHLMWLVYAVFFACLLAFLSEAKATSFEVSGFSTNTAQQSNSDEIESGSETFIGASVFVTLDEVGRSVGPVALAPEVGAVTLITPLHGYNMAPTQCDDGRRSADGDTLFLHSLLLTGRVEGPELTYGLRPYARAGGGVAVSHVDFAGPTTAPVVYGEVGVILPINGVKLKVGGYVQRTHDVSVETPRGDASGDLTHFGATVGLRF